MLQRKMVNKICQQSITEDTSHLLTLACDTEEMQTEWDFRLGKAVPTCLRLRQAEDGPQDPLYIVIVPPPDSGNPTEAL